MRQIKRLLIIRISALGDVAMTVPAIYSLAEAYPGVQLTVLTTERFASLFVDAPQNISFIGYDRQAHGGMRGFLRLLGMLRRERFDAVADLHNVLRSWLIDGWFRLTGRPVAMLDKDRGARRRLMGASPSGRNAVKPFTERYFEVFRRLGFEVSPTFNGLFPGVRPAREGGRFRVGIAPFARYRSKIYPLGQMEQVIESLSSRGDMDIFLFGGGQKELAVFHQWTARHAHVGTRAGTLSLAGELQLMASLDVMVSMDSANQHLASLSGIPVVSIWGGTTPACGFAPWQQCEDRSLLAGCECQPCTVAGSDRCRHGDWQCMTRLAPERVVEKVVEICNETSFNSTYHSSNSLKKQ